jgi:hypothetical protein
MDNTLDLGSVSEVTKATMPLGHVYDGFNVWDPAAGRCVAWKAIPDAYAPVEFCD